MPIIGQYKPKSREDWTEVAGPLLANLPEPPLQNWAFGEILDPIFSAAVERPPLRGRPPGVAWSVSQRLDHPTPAIANNLALTDLMAGANELSIVFDGALSSRGYGIPDNEVALSKCLEQIAFDAIQLRLDPHPNGNSHAEWMANLVLKRDFSPRQCDIAFGLDPIGVFARTGKDPRLEDEGGEELANLIKVLSARGYCGPFLECDGRVYAEAGADPAQELAACLATATAYLRLLAASGQRLKYSSAWIGTTLTATVNQTMTIAKFRAWRLLWRKLLSDCDLEPEPNRLHAETSRTMMMKQDPETNFLRTTSAAFSAGVAGTNGLSILPYSTAIGLPGPVARRLARNTHLLLINESHVAKVSDGAAGSGAYETLTDKLAQRAWTKFQDIQIDGGIVESLRSNLLQSRIGDSRSDLIREVVAGDATIVGVTQYRTETDTKPDIYDVDRSQRGDSTATESGLQILQPIDLEVEIREAIGTLDQSGGTG